MSAASSRGRRINRSFDWRLGWNWAAGGRSLATGPGEPRRVRTCEGVLASQMGTREQVLAGQMGTREQRASRQDDPHLRRPRSRTRLDKEIHLLSGAYGVSCRARAERKRYASSGRRFAPWSLAAPLGSPFPRRRAPREFGSVNISGWKRRGQARSTGSPLRSRAASGKQGWRYRRDEISRAATIATEARSRRRLAMPSSRAERGDADDAVHRVR
jgi:hypothetical protein